MVDLVSVDVVDSGHSRQCTVDTIDIMHTENLVDGVDFGMACGTSPPRQGLKLRIRATPGRTTFVKIPGNLHGHDTKNDTVRYPTKEVVPPILLFQDDGFGPQKFIVTAYFKHPSLICGPATTHVHTGRGLYIQTGYRVEKQYERIPLEARHLSDDWKTGTCLPSMGRHYFKNLSKDLQCEKLYPVFLMYNDEGQLGGFGLLFQGVPPSDPSRAPFKWFRHSVQFYPAIFDLTMLPPCMFNPEFHVFGYRVYLRDEHAMTCPRVQLPGISEDNAEGGAVRGGSKNEEVTFRPLNPALEPSRNSTSRPKPPKYIKPNTNVILDDVMKGAGSRNSASKNFLPVSSIYFASLLVSLSPLANIYYVSMATRLTQKLSHLALR
uniref:Uncharacterized protein n=1 Tax=Biomphalaria glabrata TaxID=6526 RepID=A0A2C9JNY2_BIOGL